MGIVPTGQRREEPLSWAELGISVNLGGPTEQDTTCPKCSHTRKKAKARCLGVNLGDGTFYCHHCAAHGSQATGWVGDEAMPYGASLPPLRQKEYKKPRALPTAPPPAMDGEVPQTEEEKAWDFWVDWYARRGIGEATLRRNRVTVVKTYMRDADGGSGAEVWAVATPYFDKGEHINTKYRAVDEGFSESTGDKIFQMSPGGRRQFYGIDDVPSDAEAITIVEGENDKLAVEEGGNPNVISVPNGAPAMNVKNYDSLFDYMDGISDRFPKCKNWIIATDNDGPGRKLAEELARRLRPERCWRVDWSKVSTDEHPIKDANDALLLWGKAKFRNEVKKIAERWPIDGLFPVASFDKKLDDWYHFGPPPALSTGWKAMDRAYKVIDSSTTLVTGIPNIGKSTFLNALAINLMMQHDFRFAICSPEWRPIEDQIHAMVKTIVGKPFHHWHPNRMSEGEMRWAREWLHERCTFVLPETPTIPSVLEVADVALERLGIRGLIVDPWSEIETSHMKPSGISQTDWIGQCLRDLRRYARSRKLHVWLVVHPTKLEKKEDGEYPVADIYDMSGSAKFADMADFVISLWRSDLWEDGETEVHIKKARFRNAGRRGEIVKLWFDEETGRYSDRPDGIGGTGTRMPWEIESNNIVEIGQKAGDD